MSVVAITEERRQAQRRSSLGRREDEVGTDDLRALIDAQRRACDRDREIYDREIEALKQSIAEERNRRERLTARVVFWAGVFAALIFLANWIGPTVVRELLRSIFGTP